MEATVTISVARGDEADALRRILSERVRLRVSERRRWFRGPVFAVTGPQEVIEAAQAEFADWRHEHWLSMQI